MLWARGCLARCLIAERTLKLHIDLQLDLISLWGLASLCIQQGAQRLMGGSAFKLLKTGARSEVAGLMNR